MLEAQDNSRARTQQVEIGPSQLGGCRRQVMYQLHGAPVVNQTERLASMMGTAIHSMIEEAFAKHGDPDDILLEIAVPGVEDIGLGPGHIDMYRKSDKSITDWKTSKLKSQRYFPKQQQRWQVHTYGFLAASAGYPVESVRLVSIPRDGTFKDIKVHEEPYDENVAWQAMDWLAELWAAKDSDWLPEPEMSGVFCTDYCNYYGPDVGMCPGKVR
jgi:hypothetical protein